MQLLRAQIRNLFSIEEVDVDLQDLGLTMVTGHSFDEGSANGAGKSSLARNSLLWGLYGVSGSARGDAVINRHGDKTASIRLDFIGVDGKQYQILRTRKPNNLSLHTPCGNELTRRNEKDTQALIDTLLGRDYKTFTQTDVFGQGKNKVFCELTSAEQKDVIESILPLEELSKWADRAKEHKKNLLVELSGLETEYTKAFSRQKTLEEMRQKLQKAGEFWENQRQRKLDGFRKQLSAENEVAKQAEVRIAELKQTIADSYVTGQIGELATLEANLETLESEIRRLTTEHDTTYTEMNLIRESAKPCPECNQPVQPDLGDTLLKLESLKSAQNQIQLTHQAVKAKIQHIQRHIAGIEPLQQEIFTLEQLRKQERDTGALQVQIDQLLKEKNPHTKNIEETKKDIQEAVEEAASHVKAGQFLRAEEARLDFWLNAFTKDLRVLMFQRACPFLQERANYYLNELGNGQISVTISTVKTLKSGEKREDFNVDVSSKTGGEVFSLLSGGEQQMVNFAVSLALSDLAESQAQGASQFTVLDEPFTNLDPRNSENVVNFLTSHLSKKKRTILLISNEDNLKGLIPNRIHVEKAHGRTRIAR